MPKKVNFSLDPNLVAVVRRLAKLEDRTTSGMVTHLLKQGLIATGYEETVNLLNGAVDNPPPAPAEPVPPTTGETEPVHPADDTPPDPEEPRPWHEPVPR